MRAPARIALTAVAAAAAFAGSVVAVSPLAGAAPSRASSAALRQYDVARPGVVTGSGITGRSQITDSAGGGSIVTVQVSGLEPGHEYGGHVHFGRCSDFLGHFKYDVSGPGTRPNEVWVDLVATPSGTGSDQVRVPSIVASGPLSVVVHAESNPDHDPNTAGTPQPGPRLACGDYVPNGS